MRSSTRESDRLRIGVIGCGNWGPNHIRVFSELDRSQVRACADINRSRLEHVARRFPQVRTTTDYRNLLDDDAIDAVVIATPTASHASLVRESLLAGKHVLVEKPLCRTASEADDLPALAEEKNLHVMVGHVFLYNNGIMRLRETIVSGELGAMLYLDTVRTNLGPIRGDVNALFDLGTHDISIFNYLIGEPPVEVSALGRSILQRGIEDVCFASLRYADGTLGHIHVSWMNPRKVRTLTIIGEKKMAHWDDLDPAETLRVYDKGIDEPAHYDSFGEFQFLLRSADVHLPKVARVEPLVNQANAFLDAVLEGGPSRSGIREGLEVVAVLDAAKASLESGGRMCSVNAPLSRRTVSPSLDGSSPTKMPRYRDRRELGVTVQ